MKSALDIYKSIDHLNDRFLLSNINLSWRDRTALTDIINYIKELELEAGDRTLYIERLVSRAFAQVFTLKYQEENGISEILIRNLVVDKVSQVLRLPKETWVETAAIDFYLDNPNNGMSIEEHKQNINLLIKDIIRFNTKELNV